MKTERNSNWEWINEQWEWVGSQCNCIGKTVRHVIKRKGREPEILYRCTQCDKFHRREPINNVVPFPGRRT